MKVEPNPELPNAMKAAVAVSQVVALVPMFLAAVLVNAALPKKGK